MTQQIPDTLRWRDTEWVVLRATSKSELLFEPEAWGVEPQGGSTACYRGFVAACAVEGDRLLLEHLELDLGRQPEGVAQGGAEEGAGERVLL